MQRIPRWIQAVFLLVLLLWMGHRPLANLLVDFWWFQSLGYSEIFTTSLWAKLGMFGGGFLLTLIFLALNAGLCTREASIDVFRLAMLIPDAPLDPRALKRIIRGVLAAAVLMPSLVLGIASAGEWFALLGFLHRQDFGTVDPVFGLDIGFFVFQLPLLHFLQTWAVAVVTLAVLVVAGFSLARDSLVNRHPAGLTSGARRQLLLLGSLLFLLVAAGWWLQRFELLFDHQGVVWGAGYTDISARLPGCWVMVGLSVAVSVVLAAAALRRGWVLPAVAAAGYLLGRVIISGAWPAVVQDYVVKPNELGLEIPYLERNIQATRAAYGLDSIEVQPYEAATGLDMEDIRANPLTIENVRVWDDRPLLTTYAQIQEIRLYYDFVDVDVDRYELDGRMRQVMLSGRELNYSNVPAQAQSWVNEHFQYTHGYGLAMSPVNRVTDEGLPDLFIRDIPPESVVDLPVERPEIYYGELTDRYVFVKTGVEEFDYAVGDVNATTHYAGDGGVPAGSLWRKLLFAVHFQSLDILLSRYMEPDSRVMFRRTIGDRISRLAPFLRFDHDPYLVVDEGRLFWIIDAYTTTARYPYAEPMKSDGGPRFNYIRNAVKVVVDAYHGSVHLYVSDPGDPLIQAYAAIFEESFKPIDQLSEGLRSHVRYPVDLFDIQGSMYRAYHMSDPTVFYNKEDMWAVPRELYGGHEQPMESYYLVMKLPGEERAEFILLVPFVPTNRDNMISWMAARCDPEVYGRLVLFQFPKKKLIYGPLQIEARIDQDPAISEMMTLWSQGGSRVVRGNLLVIPIGDALMYVEPVYLQAESSQLPELKRVIVAYESRIAMEQTLDQALRAVFGAGSPPRLASDSAHEPADTPGEQGSTQPLTGDWSVLARDASTWLQQAEEHQREGRWAEYGQSLDALSAALAQLEQLAGQTPQAAPEQLSTPAAPEAGGAAVQSQGAAQPEE